MIDTVKRDQIAAEVARERERVTALREQIADADLSHWLTTALNQLDDVDLLFLADADEDRTESEERRWLAAAEMYLRNPVQTLDWLDRVLAEFGPDVRMFPSTEP